MVKIDFPLPTDGQMHRFCILCREEGAVRVRENGKTLYRCNVCNQATGRAIYFKDHLAWLDDENELWHDGAGVFARDDEGRFLFFVRTEYPEAALTIPGGHMDNGEDAETAARREFTEETGLVADTLIKVVDESIIGDSCSAGADRHHWHAYVAPIRHQTPTIHEEGEEPVWLTLDEALGKDLVMPVHWIIERYKQKLETAGR